MFTESKAVNEETVKIRQECVLDSTYNPFKNGHYFAVNINVCHTDLCLSLGGRSLKRQTHFYCVS